MSYKTILVHLDRGAPRTGLLAVAFDLAQAFDAHLVGLFTPEPMTIPSFALAEVGPVIREIEQQRRAEAIAEAEGAFCAEASRRGSARSEWRLSSEGSLAAAIRSARYADLVVAGQPEPGAPGARGFAADLALSAGRPILFVPYAGKFPLVGKHVMVAWNAGREAARAVTDALPFLVRASSVDVVAFDPKSSPEHGADPGADVATWLARQGVKVTASRQSGTDLDIGSQILSRAADRQIDLIVMGAYGHSRLRESILGGTTRTLLESMTVPVLMSH